MESPSHVSQCPAASAMGRRTMEVTSEETTGVKTSKLQVAHHRDDEHEDEARCKSGLFYSPPPLCLSPATAAAQTQTPSTKPEASTLVACRRLSDGSEAASLGDQCPLPLTLKGMVCLESTDPRMTFSVHASITGKASVSAAQQYGAQKLYRKSNITREGIKRQYYRDLSLQVEERKQQMERERNRNVVDEQKHNDTMQHTWGMPGSGAPNYHLGTARRSESLHAAGILPQKQSPLPLPVKRRPYHPQPETGSRANGAL